MTHDDVIRMAQAAGFAYFTPVEHMARFKKFAELVAGAERDACAVVCDGVYYQHIGPEFGEVRYGIAACAAAIRARRQA